MEFPRAAWKTAMSDDGVNDGANAVERDVLLQLGRDREAGIAVPLQKSGVVSLRFRGDQALDEKHEARWFHSDDASWAFPRRSHFRTIRV